MESLCELQYGAIKNFWKVYVNLKMWQLKMGQGATGYGANKIFVESLHEFKGVVGVAIYIKI